MRTVKLFSLMILAHLAAPLAAIAQEGAAAGEHASSPGLVSLQINLMFWTLIIFLVLFFILSKYAFPPIIGAVEKREQALQAAIAAAQKDREEAERVLAEHRAQIEGARAEAQKLIADGRATADRLRQDLLEQARHEQQAIVDRARREIETERDRAIADLRREAVDLAIAGASRVVEQNLDSQGNRKLVEGFLSSLKPAGKA